MSKKFWRRLAGCIAISGCVTAAPKPEYRAGAAASEHARVVVLEDRRGYRAVFAEADFPVSRDIADFVAVQLVKVTGLDRAAIVVSGTGPAMPNGGEIVGAAAEAILHMDGAAVSFDGVISIRRDNGGCLATVYPVRLEGCRDGVAAHGPIRAAFQMIDVPHGLQTRDSVSRAYPVQAVAVGKAATVLALGGDAPAAKFAAPARIVVTHANDSGPVPDAALIERAVASILKRIR